MYKIITLVGGLVAAALIVAVPATINITKTETGTNTQFTVSIDEQSAEAGRSRSRSSSRSRSRSRPSTTRSRSRTKSKSTCCKSKNLKRKGSGGGTTTKRKATNPFGNKTKTIRPKSTTSKPKATTRTKTKSPKATTRTKTKTTARKPLSRTARGARTRTQKKSISSASSRKTRMSSQRTRSRAMRTRSRADTRRMRSGRGYWRSPYQYRRNYYWRGRNPYGWGYGYYPGVTYHRGWGMYGYGYTRGGLNIVDAMIIYSIFGHSQTSNNTTVINNYTTTEGYKAEDVVAVPQGTQIMGTAPDQFLNIPDGEGNTEEAPIPAGSTFTKIEGGMMIQTPDGQAVLIPEGPNAYKADAGYEVPESAQKPQEYDEPASEEEDSSSIWPYLGFGVLAVALAGGGYMVVRANKSRIG